MIDRRIISLSILILLFVSLCIPSRSAAAYPDPIRFDHLTVESGLSQNSIWAITQDAHGFMWFGSDDGLNQYDGYSVSIFRHQPDDPDSLMHNGITALYTDSRGDLWVGTVKGLDHYISAENRFVHYPFTRNTRGGLRGTAINVIREGPSGDIWIGTEYGGLNRLDLETGEFENWLPVENNPNSLSADTVYDLLFDQNGGLWLATSRGLNYFNVNHGVFTHFTSSRTNPTSLSSQKCTSLLIDRDGYLWVGTVDGGLNRMRTSSGRFDRFQPDPNNPNAIASGQVNDMIEDDQGILWIATRHGISLLDRVTGQFTTLQTDRDDPASLSNNTVTRLFRDRSGVIWAATYGGGVNRFSRSANKFKIYQQKSNHPLSLSDSGVYAMAESIYGSLWIGTVSGGLNRLERKDARLRIYQHIPGDPQSLAGDEIRAVYIDSLNNLWVGTYNTGLSRFDPLRNIFININLEPQRPDSANQSSINTFFEDHAGNLWIGTGGNGFYRLKRNHAYFEPFPLPVQEESAWTITVIREDYQGNLWLGTHLGIFVFDPDANTFLHHITNDPSNANSLSANQVTSILFQGEDTVWITTLRGGLDRYDLNQGIFENYSELDGLASNTLYSILEDNQGTLWMSSNRGLSRFDPLTDTFRNYDVSDGLVGNEFYPGSAFRSQRGELFFGGVNGLVSFFPEEIADNPIPPPVVVRTFQRYNQVEAMNLVGGETISLSYRDNVISFTFAALDYTAPQKNQFAYKLDGFDKDWIFAGTRNFASYTNLTGGNYTLRVKAANSDGIWNEEGIAIRIRVNPPLYATWWFITLITIGLAGVVFGGYRIRLRSIENQNRYLEKLVSERTQEIESRRQVAEGFREIIAILNSNHTLRESLDYIIRQAVRLVKADRAFILCCQDNVDGMILAGNVTDVSHLSDWLNEQVNQKQVVMIDDLAAYQQSHPELDFGLFKCRGSLALFPISTGDKVDGSLVLSFAQAGPIPEEEYKTAQALAEQAALAIGNANLRSQAEELAKSTERSRLARDLHDAVTQTLFASTLIADVLPRIWQRNPEEAQRRLEELRQLTRGALAEMRTLLIELRPGALIDASLSELLQQLCDAFTGRTRIKIDCEIEEIGPQPPEIQVAVYRIAQETLNNISKHAHASQVSVHLRQVQGHIELTIFDDGKGFDHHSLHSTHFGLGIMRERAQSIGARLHVQSKIGAGTTIRLVWQREHEDIQG